MIWVNLAKKFLGHLAAGEIESAKEMTFEYDIENLSKYDFSNIIIQKTAYNNKDIFMECLVSDKTCVISIEYDKDIGKIFDVNYYS